MELQVWQIVAGIFVSLGLGGVILAIANRLLNKGVYNAGLEGQQIRNARDDADLIDLLQDKAEKAVKKEMAKNEELMQLKTAFNAEAGVRKIQGDTVIQLAKDIGAAQAAEKICRQEMQSLKNDFESERQERNSYREHHEKEVLRALGDIRTLLERGAHTQGETS